MLRTGCSLHTSSASYRSFVLLVTFWLLSGGANGATAESADPFAVEAFGEAERLRSGWNEEALRLALAKYGEALARWRAAADGRGTAAALGEMGEVYQLLGENREALASYLHALQQSRTLDDPSLNIEALNNVCSVYAFQGDAAKAFDYCHEALRLSRDKGDRRGEAQALNNLGEAHYFSDLKQALSLFRQALALWQSVGDRRGAAQARNNIGYVYTDWSELREALTNFEQALEGWRAAGDLSGEAQTINALGVLYSKSGEKQKALAAHTQARELFRTIGSRPGELTALTGIGYVYDSLGGTEQALDCYTEALRISRAVGRREGELVLLIHAGNALDALGRKEEALKNYEDALALSRVLADTRMQAYSFNFIGGVHDAAGDTGRALACYGRALSLIRPAGDRRGEASIHNNIGSVHDRAGDKEAALRYYNSALPLYTASMDSAGEAATRYYMARALRDRGRLDEARKQIETSLSILESLRMNVTSHELRLSHFASVQEHYGLYIDILTRAHVLRPAEGLATLAFQASERARARGLLDLLAEARADIDRFVAPALRDKEVSLQQALNAKAERQMRLFGGGPVAEEEAAALAKEVRELTLEYEEVRARIREQNPRYAALTQPRPLRLEDVQQMLDDETLLLEYALGDERSYLWAVTKTGIEFHELPGRAGVEALARDLYVLLTARQPADGESPAQYEARGREVDRQYWRRAVELSRSILGPVASRLGSKRLLVVADGALLRIPFGALASPDHTGADEPTPLMLEHEVVNLPSASALALIRSGAAERRSWDKAVAVLADPVFERDDPRIEPTGELAAPAENPPADKAHRAMRDIGADGADGRIPRLLASAEEAEAIMSVIPPGTGFKAVGFSANLETARDPLIGQHRIVHLATHGFLNDQHPELSGIILSLLDERGVRATAS